MTDTATGGVFASGFSAAFRALGDVDVVGVEEKPDLVLEGVVICLPDVCLNAQSYVGSFRLYSPYAPSVGDYLAQALIPALPAATHKARLDSAVKQINSLLDAYEFTDQTWAASWPRGRYEQSIRELVGQIDSQCLEKKRAWQRAVASKGKDSFTVYADFVKGRKWIC